MNEKENIKINDNLIRRALQLEIESIEPPAADIVWRRIEARLDKAPAPLKKPTTVWLRYAGLAAAACLLLVFGSMGLLQVVQLGSPASEFDAAAEFIALDEEERSAALELAESEALEEPLAAATGPETEPDAVIEKQKQDTETIALAELDEELAEDQNIYALTPATGEYIMPPWPENIGEDHLFSEEIRLPLVEDEPLKVALYSGSEHDLLMVSSEAIEDDPKGFVEKIGLQMQFPISDLQYIDGYLFFVAGGYNGLVFHHDGKTRAILAPLSTIKKERLIDLAAPFR